MAPQSIDKKIEAVPLPKAWEDLINKLQFMPVIVKTIEKIHDVNWSMTASKHDHFEMVYIKKGNAVFQIEGIDVNMTPHSIVIIKPQKSHKFVVKSESCEFIVLSFKFRSNKDEFPSHISVTDFIEFVENEASGAYIYMKLNSKNDIVHVMNRIMRERAKQEQWGDFLSCLLIMELFVLISRNLKRELDINTRNRNLKLHELLNIAKDYIDTNYAKDITLSDVAKYIFLSDSYFAHSFKAKFNISPKSYLLKVRVEASKELLGQTDMRISEVAQRVGFSSQQRFNDIFRKMTGFTPLKFRQAERLKRLNQA